MSSGPRRDHTGPGSAPATASRDDPARTPDDAALREAVEAVSETGPDRGLLDDDIPSATDHPFAPRTLTHAMAARARQLGLQQSEEHTSELQSRGHLVCRLLLEKKKKNKNRNTHSEHHKTQLPEP